MSTRATAPETSPPPSRAGEPGPSSLGGRLVAHAAALPAILFLSLAIRLALIPLGGFQADAELMSFWAQRLATEPLREFYATDGLLDRLPGDLWILWAAANLYQMVAPEMQIPGLPFLFVQKLVPALADVGSGLVLFLLGRGFAGRSAGLLAAALYLFNPAPIFIGSIWGQWDAVSLFFVLLGLWLFLRGSPVLATAVLVYAVLVKPQFALLLPLFAAAFVLRHWHPAAWESAFAGADTAPRVDAAAGPRRGLLALGAGVAVAVLVLLPFDVGLPPLATRWTLWERLEHAWSVHPFTSVNAFNLWATPLAGIGRADDQINLIAFSDRLWGLIFLAAAGIAVLVGLWRHGGDRALVWACLTMTLATFVLPTRVHERYLLPALGLAALAAAIAPGARWVYAALTVILLGNVAAVYRLAHAASDLLFLPEASPWVAAASLLCVGVLLYLLLRGREVIAAGGPVTLAGEARALIDRGSGGAQSLTAQLRDPEARLWTDLLLVVPVIAVGVMLTVGIRLDHAPFVDNDYWWHLATGEWILDNRAIPVTDPFSWTHGGQDWIAHEWLAEAVLALVNDSAGYAGVIVFTAVLAIFGFWRLMSGVRAYGLSRRAIVLLMILWGGPFLRENVMTVRPQVWSFALFAVLLAAIAEYETGRRRTLWILPILFAFWININLTALIGLACLGAFTLDRLLHRRLERNLLIVSALSVAALLLNPRGPGLILAVLDYADPNSLRYIHIFEWMQPQLSDPTHLGFLLALPLVPVAIVQLFRGHVWPAAPLLVLAYQSFTAVRFVPLSMMVAFVFAGWLVWRRVFDVAPLPAWTPLFPRTVRSLALPAYAAAVAVAIATVVSPSQFHREPLDFWFPREAATLILDDYPGARLFNVYDYGGYLIYRFNGENLVFVDGREEMYGEPFMRRYWSLIFGEPGWQEYFDEAGIDVAVMRQVDGLRDEMAQDPNWIEVQADEYAVMFARAP